MPNSFTTTTTTGLGGRLGKSVSGMIVGLLMFLGSFGVLFWNEGRTDLSTIAINATKLNAAVVSTDAALQDTLVSVTGDVTIDETLGDGLFLTPANYVAVERNVEMYAWVEKKEEKTSANLGGSETTTTTYNYVLEWTDEPEPASKFEYPEEHENPTQTILSDEYVVDTMQVGAYTVDNSVELPLLEKLALTDDLLTLSSGAERASQEYVFMGTGTLSNPELGDLRIAYSVLEPGFEGTVIGKLDGEQIKKFVDEDGNSIYRLFTGSFEGAIATLHSEFVILTWVLRLVGFAMMWFGLASVFGPISVVLDIVPVFGSLNRGLVVVLSFPIALVLSLVTILVSMIAHSLVAVVIVALLLIGGIIYYLRKRRSNLPAKV